MEGSAELYHHIKNVTKTLSFACILFVLSHLFPLYVHSHLLALLTMFVSFFNLLDASMQHIPFSHSAGWDKRFVRPLNRSFWRGSSRVEHISLGETLNNPVKTWRWSTVRALHGCSLLRLSSSIIIHFKSTHIFNSLQLSRAARRVELQTNIS